MEILIYLLQLIYVINQSSFHSLDDEPNDNIDDEPFIFLCPCTLFSVQLSVFYSSLIAYSNEAAKPHILTKAWLVKLRLIHRVRVCRNRKALIKTKICDLIFASASHIVLKILHESVFLVDSIVYIFIYLIILIIW